MHAQSTRRYARTRRKQSTPAEQRLWGSLRKQSLGGFRFIRQVPVGPYVVDFLCRERGLVVEVDGATHGDAADVRHDSRRSTFLATQGLVVHRVLNSDVYENLGDVLDGIFLALEGQPARFQMRVSERTPSGLRPPPPAKLGGG